MMGGKHMDGHNKKKVEKMWFQNEYFFFSFSRETYLPLCCPVFYDLLSVERENIVLVNTGNIKC